MNALKLVIVLSVSFCVFWGCRSSEPYVEGEWRGSSEGEILVELGQPDKIDLEYVGVGRENHAWLDESKNYKTFYYETPDDSKGEYLYLWFVEEGEEFVCVDSIRILEGVEL